MKEYYNESGQLHKIDGPAVEFPSGTTVWYQNGKLHRVGGPAFVHHDGTTGWFQTGACHRLDGPAYENPMSGLNEWYINDRNITMEVEPWLKEQGFTWPLDEQAQSLFILRFLAQ